MVGQKLFGTLKVTNPSVPQASYVTLTFTNASIMNDTKFELELRGYVVDSYWGFKLYTDHLEALDDAQFWLRARCNDSYMDT